MRKTIRLSTFVFVLLCANFVTASATTSTVEFEVSQVSVNETDRYESVYFRIRRTGDLSEVATVVLAEVDGTATNTWDYGASPEVVTFAPGVSVMQGFLVARDDSLYETTEFCSLQLRNPSPNMRLGAQRTLTVFINDEEDYPKIVFRCAGASCMRVEPGPGREVVGSFGIRLTRPSVERITVTFTTTDVTATAGADYLPSTTTVTFEPLEFEKQLTLKILGDGLNESREFFNINLIDPINVEVPVSSISFTIVNNVPYPQQIDFDGNGSADFAAHGRDTGFWFTGQWGDNEFHLGVPDGKQVPGDYTGDGRTEAAVWEPSTGIWYVMRSEDSSYYAFPFGSTGDIPVPADFDADGVADFAVFRPSTGSWYIRRSSNGSVDVIQFGAEGDRPAPADFDGDWKADPAVYRPNSAAASQWWIKRSSDGVVTVTGFGESSDRTVAADYTGDGKADIAVWRPTTGQWFILMSEDSSYYIVQLPHVFEKPAPGDYDGDGHADYAIFNHAGRVFNSWALTRNGLNGLYGVSVGLSATDPLASVNVH